MSSSAYEQAQAAQALAADPALNVFVTANAGSGKTKVLIDRIARLLLLGSAPSSFLCITYTKAAAAEMQRRLFARLGGWCVAPDADLAHDLGQLAGLSHVEAQDLPRARALFAQALETPGGLKIQTIHAFCERLLARFPLEARTAPGFEVADEGRTKELIRSAWDRLYAEEAARDALARLGARLDQARLEALLGSLLQAKAAFGALIERHGGVSAAAMAARLRFGPATTAEAVKAELLAFAPWADLEAAARVMSGGSKNDAALAEVIQRACSTKVVEDYYEIFLTQRGEPRKRLATGAMLEAHPFLARLLAPEGEPARVAASLSRARAAERGCDAHAAVSVAGTLANAFRVLKDERATLDFDDLIETAMALLEDPGAGPWVLYKLDGGIDHILIDEGQDTSPAQWRLIAPLRAEFFAGAGARESARTVFAVGDPKQSIYSFQGADPARFLAESQALAASSAAVGAGFVAPSLMMSFRSAPQVLAAVDATFASLDMAGDPPQLFDEVRHTARRLDAPGVVEWWPFAPRPERVASPAWDAPLDQEPDDSAAARLARAVAERIVLMMAQGAVVGDDDGGARRMTPGDVLILVRSRKALFLNLLTACKRVGLPVAGADKLRLADDLAVQDLLTLAQVALDPFDDLALACLLKGPWIGLTDDETQLAPLAEGRTPGVTLWDRLHSCTDEQYAEARGFTSALRARRGWPAFEFLAQALEELSPDGRSGWLRVFERLGPETADPLQELLNRAMAASARGEAGLQAFVGSIAADDALVKRELENSGGAIRIMTVHGAKGLEAPVVFLPDTTEAANAGPGGALMVEDDIVSLGIGGAKEDDPVSGELREREAARALGEHWRLLYVAMTRARDRLIICGHGRGAGEGKAGAQSWHSQTEQALAAIGQRCDTPFGDGWRLGQPIEMGAPAGGRGADDLAFEAPDWARGFRLSAEGQHADIQPSRALAGAVLSPRTGAQRMRRGTLIHGLLQRLPDVQSEQWEEAGLGWLARQGVSGAAAHMLVAEAVGVLEHPQFAAAFGANSRAEAPVIALVRGRRVRGVVDRLVVSPTEILAIDYKTDRPPPARAQDADPAYVLQMALYREALRLALPGRFVRCAFVWTFAPSLTPLPEAAMDESLRHAGLD